MIADHDQREIRCRRLGHAVSFRYCRTQEGASVCPLIFDCWWETFDVYEFLREHLAREEFEKITRYEPRHKVLTLLDLAAQARRRAGKTPGANAGQNQDGEATPSA